MTDCLFIPYMLEGKENHVFESISEICTELKQLSDEEKYGEHYPSYSSLALPQSLGSDKLDLVDTAYTDYTYEDKNIKEFYVEIEEMGRLFIGDISILANIEVRDINPDVSYFTDDKRVEAKYQEAIKQI